jgi:hypothetical protein
MSKREEDSVLPGCDTMSFGWWFCTFRRIWGCDLPGQAKLLGLPAPEDEGNVIL